MPDISGYGNLGGEGAPVPVSGPSQQEAGTEPKASPLSSSSIQRSEMEAIALLMVAGIPVLPMPDSSGNGVSNSGQIAGIIGLSVAAREHDIISKMWDTYLDNIREIAERRKKDEIREDIEGVAKQGPKSSTEYLSYLMSVSALRRAEEIEGPGANALTVQFTNTYNTWFVNPAAAGAISGVATAEGVYPSADFIAGCVACSPDAIRGAIGADGALLGIQLSVSPVADALAAVGPASGLPVDYQAAAALVAALLYGGAVNRATAETIGQGKGAQANYDLNFATNFAKQVMAIVTKDIGAEDPTDPHRANQNNMVRLMLSAMALNLVYRSAYGGMQGKEFDDLLAGNAKDLGPIQGLVDNLVGLVNFYLPKDPKERAEMIARLMEYVDSKDSVDSMLQTSRLFTSFLNTDDVEARRLAAGRS